MLDQLLNHHHLSFGWTLRIVAFTVIPLLSICILTIRSPRGFSPTTQGPQSRAILRNPSFIVLCIGTAIYYLGLFTPQFFISLYAERHRHSASFSFYLVAIMNGANFVGRIGAGQVGDMIGFFNTAVLGVVASAVVCFCWTAVSSSAGLVVFSVAYGVASGVVIALQMPCATSLSTPETYGVAFGAVLAAGSVTGLIGTPVAGKLLESGYLALSMFAGCVLVLGGGLVAVSRVMQNRKLWVKV